MKINYNMSAIMANNSLAQTDNALSDSTERLSSGYKINHAKDSPSGIAIAKKMNAQIRGLSTATQNASDGISVIETAEGALTEIQSMLQRVNELAVKSSTGTITDSDRTAIQEEVDELKKEINRISEDTEFNGNALLNGTFDLKGYTENAAIKVESYSDESKIGYYQVELEFDVDADGKKYIKDAEVKTGTTTLVTGETETLKTVQNPRYEFDDDGHTLTIKGDNGYSMTLDVNMTRIATMSPSTVSVNVNLTGNGAMRMQIGANEGQALDIRIPTVSTKTLGIEEVDVSKEDTAKEALAKTSASIDKLSSIRSRLGAYQNRLEHTVSSLDVTSENMNTAYSRIMDTNMAEEMTEYSKYQVLSQAGTSMVAQANQRPSQVLQLLQ